MNSKNIKLKNDKYISLAQASALCSYSQEYLSLRARQGSLKAVKIGRNWVTTEKWLDQYIRETEITKIELVELQELKQV